MISVEKLLKVLRPIIPHLPRSVQRFMPGVLAFLPLAFEIANLLYKHREKIREIIGNLAERFQPSPEEKLMGSQRLFLVYPEEGLDG